MSVQQKSVDENGSAPGAILMMAANIAVGPSGGVDQRAALDLLQMQSCIDKGSEINSTLDSYQKFKALRKSSVSVLLNASESKRPGNNSASYTAVTLPPQTWTARFSAKATLFNFNHCGKI